MYPSRLLALAIGCVCSFAGAAWAGPDDGLPTLRKAVLAAKDKDEKAEAYRAHFSRVGRAGLNGLTRDDDIGIALQAAWEVHTKAIKRLKLNNRSDNIYEPVELGKFVAFLKDRTKAPVPDWWAKSIVDVDLFPGMHHAFIGDSDREGAGPKERDSKAGLIVPAEAELEEKGNRFVYSSGGRAVEFPKDTFELAGSLQGVVREKRSAIAGNTDIAGFGYSLVGFEGRGGKPSWVAEVWSSGRTGLGGVGYHWVEVAEKDGTVYVFGAETHGMYMEAFDITTGACLYRFCTCYWFHPSEKWGLM